MLRTSRSSINSSARISNWVSTKTQATGKSSLNFWDTTLLSQEKIWSVSKNMWDVWKKDRKTSTSSLVSRELQWLLLPSLKPSRREILKSSIWLTQSTSMSSSNSKISMATNWKTAQKKDLSSIRVKMRRRNSSNSKLRFKAYANCSKKCWEKKYRKCKWAKDSTNLPAR